MAAEVFPVARRGGGRVVISSATGINEWATLTGLGTHALS